MKRDKLDVIVIGAGISGLCAAHRLSRQGKRVVVLERDTVAGGTMKTTSERGFLSELGPNSALETTPLIKELVTDLGLGQEFVYADPAGSNRFILKNGRLHVLPLGPGSFLGTRLFSWKAKLRLLKEPFVGRADREESIAEFVSRRLGNEFLSYAIDPFVAGVFAGRPDRLSVRAAFPKLYALEERYGGLIRGLIGGARERKRRAETAKDRARTFSFRSGMQTLPLAIAQSLGSSVQCSARVVSISRPKVGGSYRVGFIRRGKRQTLSAPVVVLAAPAHTIAPLLRTWSRETAQTLESISYPPVASVFVAFRTEDIRHRLDGFGFLIPSLERRKILGALWSSSLFGGRTPAGTAAFTVFIGGSRQPDQALLDEPALVQLATEELTAIMQITGKPLYWKVSRWEKAIPQYEVGYPETIARLTEFERQFPGVFFCSNFIGGISVGDCVKHARETADRILAVPDPE